MKPVKLFRFTGFSCSLDLWPHPGFFKLICNLTLPYRRTDFKNEQVVKARLAGWRGREGKGRERKKRKAMTSNSLKTMFQKSAFRIVSWPGWESFPFAWLQISVFVRIVWIRPRIWTSSSNCWAPNSPRIVGLSHVFSRIGNSGSSGWRRRRGVFTTHEINTWQGICWSGEGKATVEITWPNGTAEWSGGPQAAWVAKDRLQ